MLIRGVLFVVVWSLAAATLISGDASCVYETDSNIGRVAACDFDPCNLTTDSVRCRLGSATLTDLAVSELPSTLAQRWRESGFPGNTELAVDVLQENSVPHLPVSSAAIEEALANSATTSVGIVLRFTVGDGLQPSFSSRLVLFTYQYSDEPQGGQLHAGWTVYLRPSGHLVVSYKPQQRSFKGFRLRSSALLSDMTAGYTELVLRMSEGAEFPTIVVNNDTVSMVAEYEHLAGPLDPQSVLKQGAVYFGEPRRASCGPSGSSDSVLVFYDDFGMQVFNHTDIFEHDFTPQELPTLVCTPYYQVDPRRFFINGECVAANSCLHAKTLVESLGLSAEDGVFDINPDGNGTAIPVYCAFTEDEARALIARACIASGNGNGWNSTEAVGESPPLPTSTIAKLSDEDATRFRDNHIYRVVVGSGESTSRVYALGAPVAFSLQPMSMDRVCGGTSTDSMVCSDEMLTASSMHGLASTDTLGMDNPCGLGSGLHGIVDGNGVHDECAGVTNAEMCVNYWAEFRDIETSNVDRDDLPDFIDNCPTVPYSTPDCDPPISCTAVMHGGGVPGVYVLSKSNGEHYRLHCNGEWGYVSRLCFESGASAENVTALAIGPDPPLPSNVGSNKLSDAAITSLIDGAVLRVVVKGNYSTARYYTIAPPSTYSTLLMNYNGVCGSKDESMSGDVCGGASLYDGNTDWRGLASVDDLGLPQCDPISDGYHGIAHQTVWDRCAGVHGEPGCIEYWIK